MNLELEQYAQQMRRWPNEGKHILAHYDDNTIIVYQAYRPSIANYAIENGRFGGDFSYQRMSWIKPNFLWMMYRSGWARKEDQEIILALRLRIDFFESILLKAVASSFRQSHFSNEAEWKAELAKSEVRLQWDPDHAPNGQAVSRRAIQLGLRGSALEAFGNEELLEVIDMTEFVKSEREKLTPAHLPTLQTPKEKIFTPSNPLIFENLKLDRATSL